VIIEGTALLVPQDDVDTDVLYPGAYLNVIDPNEMKQHLFEGLDPALRDQLRTDTILVTGSNFGMGSSREHVPTAMRAAGIRCVVGKSFARIFYRNCINLALPVLACPDAVAAARPGSALRVDTDAGVVEVDGGDFVIPPIPTFMLEMLDSGGLVEWVRSQLVHDPA
jgi:3-isopropylmalate/(R)-2-methylmalate dehydratase small subunit